VPVPIILTIWGGGHFKP